jgi:hypothetical protein
MQNEWERKKYRHRYTWKDIIKTDIKQIECEGVDWIILTQVRSSDGLLWTL